MVAVKGLMIIASGASESSVFNKRHHAGGLALYVPAGVQGIVSIKGCELVSGTFDNVYNAYGTLVQVDPSALTLPAWITLDADLFPHHYLKLKTFTDLSEATPQAQSAEREFKVVGVS